MSAQRLWRRVWNSLAAGTVTVVDDTGPVQKAQLTIGYMEVRDSTPVLQHFGLASSPPNGSDALLLFFGGDRSNGVVIGHGHGTTRPKGQAQGEATVFNAFGMTIALTQNGIIINSGGKPVTLNGDLHVTGAVVSGNGGGDQVSLQTHTHQGVSSGTAHTGAPDAGT